MKVLPYLIGYFYRKSSKNGAQKFFRAPLLIQIIIQNYAALYLRHNLQDLQND
jgi:hypothetical protein